MKKLGIFQYEFEYNLSFNSQDGLRNYKFRNSHLKPVSQLRKVARSYIPYRQSSHDQGPWIVLTSMEAIKENQDGFTH